ncbi:MAG: hypothetical protein DMG40_24110 [Acidobacteria bacterium]|nr:MAG: hypothetical protein DMG40_24110 [Acidobacteriota bacterium]
MELTLNLVWVGVAIAAILALFATLSSAGASLRRPASYARKVIAMGCALVILFFVISMTDDLHNQQVLVEEKKGSRIVAGMQPTLNPLSPKPLPTALLLFFPSRPFSLTALPVRRAMETWRLSLTAEIDHENLCGRAPPLSLS